MHAPTPLLLSLSLFVLYLPSVLSVTYCARPQTPPNARVGLAHNPTAEADKESKWREACAKSGLAVPLRGRATILEDYLSDIHARGADAEPPTFALPSGLGARDADAYVEEMGSKGIEARDAEADPKRPKIGWRVGLQQGLRNKHPGRDLDDGYLAFLEARDAEAEADPKKPKISWKGGLLQGLRNHHPVRDLSDVYLDILEAREAEAEADAEADMEAEILARDILALDAILDARALNGAYGPVGLTKTSKVADKRVPFASLLNSKLPPLSHTVEGSARGAGKR